MPRRRSDQSAKGASHQTKVALYALQNDPLAGDLQKAMATGDANEIERAQSALKESPKDLPPLNPLIVEFVKALARDHARQDKRAAARLRASSKTVPGSKD